jgi:hypothetical protein
MNGRPHRRCASDIAPFARQQTHLRAEGEALLLRGLYSSDPSSEPSSEAVTPVAAVRAERCAIQSGSTPAPSCRRKKGGEDRAAGTW